MLIDVSDKIKIPIEIEQKILSRFIAMSERNISAIKAYKIQYDRDVICAIENYIGPSSAYYFYQELNSLFKQYEMVCYHSTKTIDEKSYRNTNSYSEVHEDWWSRLFGNHAGNGASAVSYTHLTLPTIA